MIDPLWWPFVLVGAVIAIAVVASRRRHAVGVHMAALAREVRMNYSAIDRFDLASRLQQSPHWTGGLTVRDIIYGASGNERRFVATVERRATMDDRPRCQVIACIERLDDGVLRQTHEPIRLKRGEFTAAYREMLENLRPQ